jgi:hypothetical protein
MFAVKLLVEAPAATLTLAGTATAELLLATLTANPPLGAAAFRVTVQLSVPAPVIDELPQLSPVNSGGFAVTWLAASSCTPKVSATPAALAVNVAVSAVLTAEALAVKLTAVDPSATVTDAGTATALLLLVRLTANPPLVAAELSATVQVSLAGPVTVAFTQLSELNAGGFGAPAAVPVPLNPTTRVPLAAPSLAIVSSPVAAPAAVGEKFTLKLNVRPAATVTGRSPAPLTEKDCPARVTFETFTAADPWFTSEILALVVVPMGTLPKLTLFGDA